MAAQQPLDVLIVGAGLSGIDAAYRIREKNPDVRYQIVEQRERIGGTWDLFRYPGVRSDSDIFTLSFPFRPWDGDRTVALGDEIRTYLDDTARELDIAPHIRFSTTVRSADFDTDTDLWTVTVEDSDGGEQGTITARFLYVCTGYYRYDAGYTPEFPGVEQFSGQIVHPQFWPGDLDTADKKVVVIGSGATAVTLAPALAPDTERVTVLQRSPTYLLPMPWQDQFTKIIRRVFPAHQGGSIIRWRNALITIAIYLLCRRFPRLSRRVLRRLAIRLLPKGFDVDTHFRPAYDPWDERMCVIPDGDFYRAVGDGSVEVVTDRIESFTPTGIRLVSGAELAADIVVTATGLDLVAFGGAALRIDGVRVDPHDRFAYRGYMLSEVPNMAWSVGYTNASWTMRVDLTAQAVADLLAHMRRNGYRRATPELGDPSTLPERRLLALESGYVKRAADRLPKASDANPWLVRHNLVLDAYDARHYDVAEAMRFEGGTGGTADADRQERRRAG